MQRYFELVPVSRAIQGVIEIARHSLTVKRGPTKSVTLAVALEDDWTMTRNGHLVRDDVMFGTRKSFSNLDLFATNHGILPTGGRLIPFRISGIKLFEIKILHVWSNVSESPRDMFVVTDDHAGQSG